MMNDIEDVHFFLSSPAAREDKRRCARVGAHHCLTQHREKKMPLSLLWSRPQKRERMREFADTNGWVDERKREIVQREMRLKDASLVSLHGEVVVINVCNDNNTKRGLFIRLLMRSE